MTHGGAAAGRQGPSGRAIVVYLVSAACLSACITILFLSMRAVMDIGGYCAEGGPYEIAVHCPEGVAILVPLGMMGGMAAAFIMGAAGDGIGGPYGSLPMLAWPAVFISLGWNFLEYGIWPPAPAEGPVLGWIFTGIVFMITGGAPLVAALGLIGAAGRHPHGEPPPLLAAAGASQSKTPAVPNRLAEPAPQPRPEPTPQPAPGADGVMPMAATFPDETVAADLERLAALHRSGALDDEEFAAAKRRRLGAETAPGGGIAIGGEGAP
jgi:hypothetical protein